KLNNLNNSSDKEIIIINHKDQDLEKELIKSSTQFHTRVKTDNGISPEYDSDFQIKSSIQQQEDQYSEDNSNSEAYNFEDLLDKNNLFEENSLDIGEKSIKNKKQKLILVLIQQTN
ncbi:9867_t:CDS:2, partial [Dentiscutata heterogama]